MDNSAWIPVTKDTLPPLGEWVLLWHSENNVPVLSRLEKGIRGRRVLSWEVGTGSHATWYRVFPYNLLLTHWCKVEIPPPPT